MGVAPAVPVPPFPPLPPLPISPASPPLPPAWSAPPDPPLPPLPKIHPPSPPAIPLSARRVGAVAEQRAPGQQLHRRKQVLQALQRCGIGRFGGGVGPAGPSERVHELVVKGRQTAAQRLVLPRVAGEQRGDRRRHVIFSGGQPPRWSGPRPMRWRCSATSRCPPDRLAAVVNMSGVAIRYDITASDPVIHSIYCQPSRCNQYSPS